MSGSRSKAVIIGMGFLATYVMPCYKKTFGEDLAGSVVGIKGSERGLKEKQAECPFPVVVGGALEVLKEKRPEMIFLAVKPHQVKGVVAETLVPYYAFLREQGEAFPDLLSFAPDPVVAYYYDTIGEDIHAVNLIPNMASVLEGVDVAVCGTNFAAFDPRDNWEASKRERALRFLDPVGTTVEITGEKAVEFLSTQVVCHLMYEHAMIMQDVCAEAGIPMSLAKAAKAYRAMIHKFFKEDCVNVLPTETDGIDEKILSFMDIQMDAFHKGVMDFSLGEGFAFAAADRMVCGSMETYMMEPQLETREQLEINTRNHSTPGGFTEKCVNTFRAYGYGYTEDALRACIRGEELPGLSEELRKIAHDVTKAISDHGKTLSGTR